jgi:hypothetical protein
MGKSAPISLAARRAKLQRRELEPLYRAGGARDLSPTARKPGPAGRIRAQGVSDQLPLPALLEVLRLRAVVVLDELLGGGDALPGEGGPHLLPASPFLRHRRQHRLRRVRHHALRPPPTPCCNTSLAVPAVGTSPFSPRRFFFLFSFLPSVSARTGAGSPPLRGRLAVDVRAEGIRVLYIDGPGPVRCRLLTNRVLGGGETNGGPQLWRQVRDDDTAPALFYPPSLQLFCLCAALEDLFSDGSAHHRSTTFLLHDRWRALELHSEGCGTYYVRGC